MGHGKSHLSRVRRSHRSAPGNDPGRVQQHRMSRICETNMGGVQVTELQALEAGLAADQGRLDESGIDRQELLSWSIQTLMAAAG